VFFFRESGLLQIINSCCRIKVETASLCSCTWAMTCLQRFQLNTYGRRAFAVAAPATWNSLSDYCETGISKLSALEALCDYAL